MRSRSIIVFVLAVFLSLAAAVFRWGDSSHAIGLLSVNGGKARHPSHLVSGWDRYTQITTITVLPPYRGDVRIRLAGDQTLDYELRFSKPVVELGLNRRPDFRDNILYGVEPGDRLALWVLMHPFPADPVCGMTVLEETFSTTYRRKIYRFCGQGCLDAFQAEPERYPERVVPVGTYRLVFEDTSTGKTLLTVPLIFKSGEASHASSGHH